MEAERLKTAGPSDVIFTFAEELPHKQLPLDLEAELIAYIRCEYAFQVRTPEQLPNMAKKPSSS